MQTVLVRYGELALKSEPVRRLFEHQLINNITRMLGKNAKIRRVRGRIFVYAPQPRKTARILSKIPGVVSCSPAIEVPADMSAILDTALKEARRRLRPGMRFAVRAKRHGDFPLTSQQINQIVGAGILKLLPKTKVDLEKPDLQIFIEIWENKAYVFSEIVDGPGGLPVGTQGKALAWFEGKRADTEAAALMFKRGCELELVIPHRKALKKARQLLRYHYQIVAHVLPTEVLKKRGASLDYSLKCALAEAIANKRGVKAIVMPDTVQTLVSVGLEKIGEIDKNSSVLILRPLVGPSLLKTKKQKKKEVARVGEQRALKREISKIVEKTQSVLLRVKP